MKRLALLFAFMAVLMITACDKEEEQSPTTGTIRFTNLSSNPYKCYIESAYQGDCPGQTFREFETGPGAKQVKAIQISGYLIYPTVVTNYIGVAAGEDYEFIFP